ncbi:hypothetical protein F5144DRAFT_594736 [Chaetomium tenue]|uniref:Uncharacterized protein n=1 Tax=Chaetomium tenue TaxID=1854479 RepID=A0ACB7P4N4_9PEZI|nr:hypothetical protein F5144DRAFT_594736 [Chaetomium globosum]
MLFHRPPDAQCALEHILAQIPNRAGAPLLSPQIQAQNGRDQPLIGAGPPRTPRRSPAAQLRLVTASTPESIAMTRTLDPLLECGSEIKARSRAQPACSRCHQGVRVFVSSQAAKQGGNGSTDRSAERRCVSPAADCLAVWLFGCETHKDPSSNTTIAIAYWARRFAFRVKAEFVGNQIAADSRCRHFLGCWTRDKDIVVTRRVTPLGSPNHQLSWTTEIDMHATTARIAGRRLASPPTCPSTHPRTPPGRNTPMFLSSPVSSVPAAAPCIPPPPSTAFQPDTVPEAWINGIDESRHPFEFDFALCFVDFAGWWLARPRFG